MAQADISVVAENQLPTIVELYNQVFRPPETEDYFRRRFQGRYNVLAMLASLDNRRAWEHRRWLMVDLALAPTRYPPELERRRRPRGPRSLSIIHSNDAPRVSIVIAALNEEESVGHHSR